MIRPELGQGWTLNYEMFFYLVFGVSLLMPRAAQLALIMIVFGLLSLIGFIAHPSNPILATYCDSLSIEFLFGVVIAYLISNRSVSKREIAYVWALVAFSIALIILQIVVPRTAQLLPRFIGAGIPAASIVAGALWLERTGRIHRVAFLLLLGDASYSLYLFHVLVRWLWESDFTSGLRSQ